MGGTLYPTRAARRQPFARPASIGDLARNGRRCRQGVEAVMFAPSHLRQTDRVISPETTSQDSGEVRSLTGLRGVAALYVVLYHFGARYLVSGRTAMALHQGYLSVDLFFVLSGFVMAMVYGPRFAGRVRLADIRTFMTRRVARIYPLYLALLPLGLWQELPSFLPRYHAAGFAGVIMANLLLVQSWDISRSFIGPAWSISTEWAAYLLFPWLMAGLAGAKRSSLVIIAAIAVLMIAMSAAHTARTGGGGNGLLDIWSGDGWGPLLRCLPEFTLGVLAFAITDWPATRRLFAPRWLSLALALVIMALLGAQGSDVAVVLLFPPLILSLRDDRSWLARLLATGPLHWLGLLSYAIYLMHYFFVLPAVPSPHSWQILVVKLAVLFAFVLPAVPSPHSWQMLVVKLAMLFAFAVLAHEVIEKPGRRFCRRLFESETRVAKDPNPNLAAPCDRRTRLRIKKAGH